VPFSVIFVGLVGAEAVISTNGYCIVRKDNNPVHSEWTIFKITALSAPYSVKFNFITRDKVPLYAKGPHAKW
jgi:hypothetical protein